MLLVLTNLINIYATPTDAFLNIKEKPQWIVAFCFIAFATIVAAFFTGPLTIQIMHVTLSQSGNLEKEQIERAIAFSERFQYIGLAIAPIYLLLRWLVIAGVLYFLAILLGTEALKFKTVYTVVVYSEMILLLMGVINILLLYLKGVDSVHHITDLQAIVGLDVLLTDKTANLPLFTLLNSVNVFSIWYLATLTIGISIATNFSKLKAGVLVTSVWLIGVGFQVALTAISSNFSAAMGSSLR